MSDKTAKQLDEFEKLQRSTGLLGDALEQEWLRRQEKMEPPMFDHHARLSHQKGWLPLNPYWVMR